VARLCRVLGVSRSGYYAWRSRPPSPRAISDAALSALIAAAHDGSVRTYGAPRIWLDLREDHGIRCGRKRVARLMRADGRKGVCRRKFRRGATVADPTAQRAPDLVERRFVADRPDQLWVADVTYVPTRAGWLYLAVVIDVFSRLVVGWSMNSTRKAELVVDAVRMAVARRGGHVPGVIHHSDQGGEYSSHDLARQLRTAGILPSMGSVADCYDNALAESFFATVECELFDHQHGGSFDSHHQARLAIFNYIEAFYNRRRRHTSIGGISPQRFEEQHRNGLVLAS
jgi:putative transposase